MHCASDDVAVTSGDERRARGVLAGLDLGPGDEILTTDSEHPGLLGPLIAARHRGASVRAVPIASWPRRWAPRRRWSPPRTSWITGEIAPPELAEVGVPVILDGAQGAGAVPVDVLALGCVAYAAAGQKWLCGADGTGMLYLQPEFARAGAHDRADVLLLRGRLRGPGVEPASRCAALRQPDRARGLAISAAALDVLEAEGFDTFIARATELAETFASRLKEAGRTVAARALHARRL